MSLARLFLLSSLLATPQVVLAEAPRWDFSGAATVGFTHSTGGRSVSDATVGIRTTIAYRVIPQLALAGDYWTMWGASTACPHGVRCASELVSQQNILTAGPRWTPVRSLYVQATAGVGFNRFEVNARDRMSVSPAATVVAGWQQSIGLLHVGAELRGNAQLHGETWVYNAAGGLIVGSTW